MPKYTVTQTITAFTAYEVEAENGEIAESLVESYGEEVEHRETRTYPEGSIKWLDRQNTEVFTDREWTSLELAHLMSDRHAQGVHEDDPASGCYDCWPWTHGYGERVLELLSVFRSDLDWEWWHSGGGIFGISGTDNARDRHYFIGAADEPNVGMDVTTLDGTIVGSKNFGSLVELNEDQMTTRILLSVGHGVNGWRPTSRKPGHQIIE